MQLVRAVMKISQNNFENSGDGVLVEKSGGRTS